MMMSPMQSLFLRILDCPPAPESLEVPTALRACKKDAQTDSCQGRMSCSGPVPRGVTGVPCIYAEGPLVLCRRQRPVYLLNYSVYKPPDSWKSSHKSFLDNSIACGVSLVP